MFEIIVKVKSKDASSNTLGPVLGPLQLPSKKVADQINILTKNQIVKKVYVKISIAADKTYKLTLQPPTVAITILTKLGLSKGSPAPKTQSIGKLNRSQVIQLAKSINTYSTNLDMNIKQIIGAAKSLGVLVNE